MADQAPSFESVQRALEAHLAPSVHLQSLPRALELLAHVALIADKLSEEVARILDVSARMHTRNRLEGLSDRSVERLQRCKADAEKASTRIWQLSVDLRLNHIAAVLSPAKKVSIKILYLIDCYFPEPMFKAGPSSSKKTYKSSKLFIRAMSDRIAQEYKHAGRVSREWYEAASESTEVSKRQAWPPSSKRENGAVLAKQALAYTTRLFDCTRKVERILANDTGPRPPELAIKAEIKTETRDSRSPSPNRLSKAPQLDFTRRKRLSSNISVTRSITPKFQRIQERATSLAETEAMLTIPKDEVPSSDLPEATEAVGGILEAEVKPAVPQKPKKRPRPSLPPREGPDYTRPLPQAPTKKLRTFELGDLKR